MSSTLLLFLSMVAVCFCIFLMTLSPVAASRSTLQRLAVIQSSLHEQVAPPAASALEKAEPWTLFAGLNAAVSRFRLAKAVDTLLMHANSRIGLSGLLLVSFLSGAVCGVIIYLFVHLWLLSVLVATAGCTAPYLFLQWNCRRRLHAFNEALPDAIDLMARALVAGHSVGSSLEMVAQESPQPLASEFMQVYQQQRLGLQFRDALVQMNGRMPSRDLQFLITAILVQKETGGDLTEILARAAYVIRERIRIQGEVRTRTAQGRLTGWILSLLPIILLVLINLVSPGYSDILFHDPVGKDLLYAGALLIGVGALIIRKVVDVQV
jgi:tight adherence protein B